MNKEKHINTEIKYINSVIHFFLYFTEEVLQC